MRHGIILDSLLSVTGIILDSLFSVTGVSLFSVTSVVLFSATSVVLLSVTSAVLCTVTSVVLFSVIWFGITVQWTLQFLLISFFPPMYLYTMITTIKLSNINLLPFLVGY